MIVIVTGSERKKQEISQFIDNRISYRYEPIDLEEIQGSSEEIVGRKLKEAHKKIQGPVVVEDYSLYIDALYGLPGPYVKWCLHDRALENIVAKLSPLGDLHCTQECIYGYCDGFGETHIFKGTNRGVLRPSDAQISPNFAIDQLLVPEGAPDRFLCLSEEEKAKYSVRKKAIDLLVAHVNAARAQPEYSMIEEACISSCSQ